MAILSKTINGKSVYEVYVNGHDSNGKRWQRRKSNIPTLQKAKSIEFELKRELAKVKDQPISIRWSEWFKDCMLILKTTYRPSSLYSYEKVCNKWVNRHFNDLELKSISKLEVHNLIYDKMIGPRVTEHTRKFVLKIVKRIFQLAVEHGKLDRNPCIGMTVKVPETEQKILSNAEAQKLLNETKITNHRFYPIWVVALFTGMRSGELFALRWSDIDFETGNIRVGRSWNRKNGFTCTKNQKHRVIPIADDLMVFLKELKLSRGIEEFVLPHLKEWVTGDAAYVLQQFCKSIGITPIRFHDLRATFITNLLSRGESLVRVMAIVGHSDMETTNVYVRKAGIGLSGGTDKLGYSVYSGNFENNVLKFSPSK